MQGDRPPILRAQREPGFPPTEGSVPAVRQLAGARVLVVEDNDDARELMCALLEMAGATVLCVESVAKAMDGVCQSFEPNVVLTDFSMPNATGLDLIREFRKATSTRAIPIPILVLSGHSENNWRERALEAGAADVLDEFPIDQDTYVAIVGRGHRVDHLRLRLLVSRRGRPTGHLAAPEQPIDEAR